MTKDQRPAIDVEGALKHMIDNKINQLSLDTWGSEGSEKTKLYFMLPNNLNKRYFYEGYEFLLNYSSGGGAGMGAYPPTKKVFMLHKFEV